MPTNRDMHHAFYATYKGITDELTTPVTILPVYTNDPILRGIPVKIEALWDTGATATCIKPSLWERLKLYPLESSSNGMEVSGIGGKVTTALTLLNLQLTSELEIEYCPVYSVDFPGDADILIGMDIISLGDFAISNTGNITSFSFVMPPLPERINFAEKIKILR